MELLQRKINSSKDSCYSDNDIYWNYWKEMKLVTFRITKLIKKYESSELCNKTKKKKFKTIAKAMVENMIRKVTDSNKFRIGFINLEECVRNTVIELPSDYDKLKFLFVEFLVRQLNKFFDLEHQIYDKNKKKPYWARWHGIDYNSQRAELNERDSVILGIFKEYPASIIKQITVKLAKETPGPTKCSFSWLMFFLPICNNNHYDFVDWLNFYFNRTMSTMTALIHLANRIMEKNLMNFYLKTLKLNKKNSRLQNEINTLNEYLYLYYTVKNDVSMLKQFDSLDIVGSVTKMSAILTSVLLGHEEIYLYLHNEIKSIEDAIGLNPLTHFVFHYHRVMEGYELIPKEKLKEIRSGVQKLYKLHILRDYFYKLQAETRILETHYVEETNNGIEYIEEAFVPDWTKEVKHNYIIDYSISDSINNVNVLELDNKTFTTAHLMKKGQIIYLENLIEKTTDSKKKTTFPLSDGPSLSTILEQSVENDECEFIINSAYAAKFSDIRNLGLTTNYVKDDDLFRIGGLKKKISTEMYLSSLGLGTFVAMGGNKAIIEHFSQNYKESYYQNFYTYLITLLNVQSSFDGDTSILLKFNMPSLIDRLWNDEFLTFNAISKKIKANREMDCIDIRNRFIYRKLLLLFLKNRNDQHNDVLVKPLYSLMCLTHDFDELNINNISTRHNQVVHADFCYPLQHGELSSSLLFSLTQFILIKLDKNITKFNVSKVLSLSALLLPLIYMKQVILIVLPVNKLKVIISTLSNISEKHFKSDILTQLFLTCNSVAHLMKIKYPLTNEYSKKHSIMDFIPEYVTANARNEIDEANEADKDEDDSGDEDESEDNKDEPEDKNESASKNNVQNDLKTTENEAFLSKFNSLMMDVPHLIFKGIVSMSNAKNIRRHLDSLMFTKKEEGNGITMDDITKKKSYENIDDNIGELYSEIEPKRFFWDIKKVVLMATYDEEREQQLLSFSSNFTDTTKDDYANNFIQEGLCHTFSNVITSFRITLTEKLLENARDKKPIGKKQIQFIYAELEKFEWFVSFIHDDPVISQKISHDYSQETIPEFNHKIQKSLVNLLRFSAYENGASKFETMYQRVIEICKKLDYLQFVPISDSWLIFVIKEFFVTLSTEINVVTIENTCFGNSKIGNKKFEQIVKIVFDSEYMKSIIVNCHNTTPFDFISGRIGPGRWIIFLIKSFLVSLVRAGLDLNRIGDPEKYFDCLPLKVFFNILNMSRWVDNNFDIEIFSVFVEAGMDVTVRDNFILRRVSKMGCDQAVEYLLSKGADANSPDVNGPGSALRQAVTKGHLQVVKLLIEKGGANPHQEDKWGIEGPIRYAALNGHIDILKYLIEEHKCDIHTLDNYIIYWSSRKLHMPIVEYLIENGADIDKLDQRVLKLIGLQNQVPKKPKYTDQDCIIMYEPPQIGDLYLECPNKHVIIYENWVFWSKNHTTCPYCTVEVNLTHLYRQISKDDENTEVEGELSKSEKKKQILKKIKKYNNKKNKNRRTQVEESSEESGED